MAIEYHREEDGRWLADIPALPGVTAYGKTRKQATASVQALALRLIADRGLRPWNRSARLTDGPQGLTLAECIGIPS